MSNLRSVTGYLTSRFSGAAIAAGLLVGFALGYLVSWQAGQAKFAQLKQFFPPVPEFQSISGTVTRVQGDTVIVEASSLAATPFEKLPTTRRVKVAATTELLRRTAKDPKEYAEEVAEYQKQVLRQGPGGVPGTLGQPPLSFKEEKILLLSLAISFKNS